MTFYEENRPSDLTLSEVIDCLYLFFPEIEKQDVTFFYHGTYNVFEVKNKFIIRIPDKAFRNRKGVRLISNEVKMLHHIQKFISVPVPDPIYISTDLEYPFMGYRKIDGIPLSRCFNKISRHQKLNIAKEIGNFLTELHSEFLFQNALTNQIVKNNFSCEKYKQDWEVYFDKVHTKLFPLMSSNQKDWIVNLFNSFLNVDANFDFKYSIIHGDFDISNIVIDPKSFKIVGIVDFEESRVYDRAADFLFYDEGDFFLREILSNYEEDINQNFEERMKFLYGRSCLGYIEFGMQNNLSDMINVGFQLLKKRIKRFPK